jgi:hypothetical protein
MRDIEDGSRVRVARQHSAGISIGDFSPKVLIASSPAQVQIEGNRDLGESVLQLTAMVG